MPSSGHYRVLDRRISGVFPIFMRSHDIEGKLFKLTLQQFSLFNPPDILTVREKAHGARTYSAEVTRRGVSPQAAIYGFIAACFLRKVHTAPITGLYRIQHFPRFVKGPGPVFLHKISLPQPFSGVRSVQSGHFPPSFARETVKAARPFCGPRGFPPGSIPRRQKLDDCPYFFCSSRY